jgi:hypothetical protein
MLAIRARKNDYLPRHWEKYFHDPGDPRYWAADQSDFYFMGHPIHNHLSLTGVPCPLLPLNEGESIEIQFAVAWANTDEFSSTATSIAVEASPSQILGGGGCS